MGRLKALAPRLSALPPNVAAMPKMAEGFYASAEWKDYRARHRAWTAAREGGVWCVVCGSTWRLILDHDAERKDGGADFPPFEQAHWHCGGCHNLKTARERAKRARGEVKTSQPRTP